MLNNLVWTCQHGDYYYCRGNIWWTTLEVVVFRSCSCPDKSNLLSGSRWQLLPWMTRVLTPQPNHRHPMYSLECQISAWKLCQNPTSRDSFNHVVTTQLCNLPGWGSRVWYGDGSISLHLNVIFSSEQMDWLLCGDCHKSSKNSWFWQAEAV